MIHIKKITVTYHKKTFVVREYGNGAICTLDVKGGSLGARGSRGNLQKGGMSQRARERMRKKSHRRRFLGGNNSEERGS